MNGVIQLKDGSTHSVVSEEDLLYLVEKYMGHEARDALTEMIGDAFLQGADSTKDEIEEWQEKYEALKEEMEEGRDW